MWFWMKKRKNKYILVIIEVLISILISLIFSNILHICNYKYQVAMFILFFVLIYIYNIKNLFFSYKKYIKIFIFTFVFSSICLPLCFDSLTYKTSYFTIEPMKNENSSKSNEIWIYGISINDKDVNLNKIINNSWTVNNNCIVYRGNEYNTLKIRVRNKIKNIKIKYAKADNLTTKFQVDNKVYDTYSDKWELKKITIEDIFQEKKNIVDICISIICYYLFGVMICIFLYPFSKNKSYRNIIVIALIYMYSVYYYNSIFLITGLLILTLLCVLLRNWSVANEEDI